MSFLPKLYHYVVQEDDGWCYHLPSSRVMVPGDETDSRGTIVALENSKDEAEETARALSMVGRIMGS